MSGTVFRKGESYVGTATVDSHRQKVFTVVGRRGDLVSFAESKNVRRELTDECDGNEIVKIQDADGFDYFLSARVAVDIDGAFNVVKMCQA